MKFGWRLVDNSMPLPPNFRWMNDGGDEDIEFDIMIVVCGRFWPQYMDALMYLRQFLILGHEIWMASSR